jgi:valyl-tRNA synthetase
MTAIPPSPESATDLPQQYDPAAAEPEIYARWIDAQAFRADASRSDRVGGGRDPFTIVMPPPNVTAILHVGHALNSVVQDVLIRWRRMSGDETLWLPGTDHAGIATQNIIERQLAKEGTSRTELGREAFVARTANFVRDTGGTILEQLRALGVSADWSRTAYTFSPALSRSVREAFVRLYDEGLIYRGHRVIHWCPRCLTSLSDEEAEHETESGRLYHIRYPLTADPSRGITVATTRPETMLGDVAVVVHPADARYADLIGQTVTLPLVNRPIPIIADEAVDPTFGSGAVKVTPAHDPNDFEIGRRHGLPMPIIMTPYGTMDDGTDAAGRVPERFRGLDRFVARDAIVAALDELDLLVRVEPHEHAVRHCYRCGTVVEPRLSDQWFVRMAPLAAPALAALRNSTLRILPERWEGVYVNWLENIRDWNISRQLWWGQRVPVWSCSQCDWTAALRDDPTDRCPSCGAAGTLTQDEDVLDTWFSSWLWPLSTLGWPDDTPDFRAFYPTSMIVSGPDILFFWVSRMIMAGLHFAGHLPFQTVYLHGIVRDTNHEKMSKSKGNGIDPLDVVRLFGADALRYTLVAGMGLGTDVIVDPTDLERSFAPGRNFATKLWNIGRHAVLAKLDGEPVRRIGEFATELTRADAWILDRLDVAVGACDAALGPSAPASGRTWSPTERGAGLRLNEYAEAARAFVWNDLADWYVEHCKARLAPEWDRRDREIARAVLVHALDAGLRLLHPIVPFVTETLWQALPTTDPGTFLATSAWPLQRDGVELARGLRGRGAEYERVREAVSALRQLRADYRIPPARQLDAVILPVAASVDIFVEEAEAIGRLARCSVRVAGETPPGAAAAAVLSDGSRVVVPLEGVIDVEKECARLRAERDQLARQLDALRTRLAGPFAEKGRPDVVQAERRKAEEWAARLTQLDGHLRALCGG